MREVLEPVLEAQIWGKGQGHGASREGTLGRGISGQEPAGPAHWCRPILDLTDGSPSMVVCQPFA